MPLPKELCLNRYDEHVCLLGFNHKGAHIGSNINNRSATWIHVKTAIEANYERLQKENEALNSRLNNQSRTIIDQAQQIRELQESKQSWIDRYYRRNAVIEERDNTINELALKIQNQAKSLTEMHKNNLKAKRLKERYIALKMEYSSIYGKSNTDLIAERNILLQERNNARNDYYRVNKELTDLRENFAYNENSWRESNTNLKNELNTANETIADYQTVIKQKDSELEILHRTNMNQATKLRTRIDPNEVTYISLKSKDGTQAHNFRVE